MNETNGFCKGHTGVMEALEHVKQTQIERNETITRIWTAIESRVSTKVFLSLLSIAVAVLGMIMGSLFYNQDHVLASLQTAQSATLDRIVDMKLDVEIIKQQLRPQNQACKE